MRSTSFVSALASVAVVAALAGCAADLPSTSQRPVSPQLELLSDPSTVTQFSGIGETITATITAGDVSRTLGRPASGTGTFRVFVTCAGGSAGAVSVGDTEFGSVSCGQRSTPDSEDSGYVALEGTLPLDEDQTLTVSFDESSTATVTVQVYDEADEDSQ
ncbi:MAG: hypothetical protein ACTJHU_02180 [Mycetocola sp.]